jgi:hypothetical protein
MTELSLATVNEEAPPKVCRASPVRCEKLMLGYRGDESCLITRGDTGSGQAGTCGLPHT